MQSTVKTPRSSRQRLRSLLGELECVVVHAAAVHKGDGGVPCHALGVEDNDALEVVMSAHKKER